MAGFAKHHNRGGERYACIALGSFGHQRFSAWGETLDRQMNQALGRNLSAGEAVDRDSAARIGFAVAFGIGLRRHAGVDVATIAAKMPEYE